MKTHFMSLGLVVLLLAPARADTVFLEDGTILENVKTKTQDGKVVAATELGERVFAADQVRSIAPVEHFADKDELARRREATSDDVQEMKAFSAWCETHGFHKEARNAWRAWLDRSLAACSKAGDYVDLAWKMNLAGFSDADRRGVLQTGKKLDPENEGVKKALSPARGEDAAREELGLRDHERGNDRSEERALAGVSLDGESYDREGRREADDAEDDEDRGRLVDDLSRPEDGQRREEEAELVSLEDREACDRRHRALRVEVVLREELEPREKEAGGERKRRVEIERGADPPREPAEQADTSQPRGQYARHTAGFIAGRRATHDAPPGQARPTGYAA